MAILGQREFRIPTTENILDRNGMLSKTWEQFFLAVQDRLNTLGEEKVFTLNNANATPTPITGLYFDKSQITFAIIDYHIQRYTTGIDAESLYGSGTLFAWYNPATEEWEIDGAVEAAGPTHGVTISISPGGQVLYETTDVDGVPQISRFIYRSRTFTAKSIVYSKFGGA